MKLNNKSFIVVAAATLVVLTGLFPPWINTRSGHDLGDAGYSCIFFPPPVTEQGIKIDATRLVIEWFCILAVSGAAFYLQSRRKFPANETAELPDNYTYAKAFSKSLKWSLGLALAVLIGVFIVQNFHAAKSTPSSDVNSTKEHIPTWDESRPIVANKKVPTLPDFGTPSESKPKKDIFDEIAPDGVKKSPAMSAEDKFTPPTIPVEDTFRPPPVQSKLADDYEALPDAKKKRGFTAPPEDVKNFEDSKKTNAGTRSFTDKEIGLSFEDAKPTNAGYEVVSDFEMVSDSDVFLDYKKKAEKGDAIAQNNLGFCFLHGNGTIKDYVEAAKWFHKSSDQGCELGMYNLGWCYRNGAGLTQDFVEAYKWYNLASAKGNASAKKNLSILEKKMKPEQITEAQRLSREFKPGTATP